VSPEELAAFLVEHPDWSPAILLTTDNRVGCYGTFGPTDQFVSLPQIQRFLKYPQNA